MWCAEVIKCFSITSKERLRSIIMDTYIYTVLDKQGKKISGEMVGEDINKIKKILKDKGLYVIQISTKVSSFPLLFRQGIKETDLVVAMRELATFVSSKLPLDECLTGVTSQMKAGKLKVVFESIQKKIREGKSFSEALRDFPAVFSEMIVSMVRTGEEIGTLDKILLRISDFLEKRQTFKSKIRSIMSYPVFMLVISIAVFIFLLSFVTPTITRIFSEIDIQLPLSTMILIEISGFFKAAWIYIIMGLIVVFFAVKKFFTTDKGAKIVDLIRFHTPFLSNLLIKREIILFSRTISTLIEGGVDIIESLKIASQVISSPSLKNEIREIIESLSKGGSLSASFRNSKYFPYLVTQLVTAGERSGTLSEMFNKIGEIYEEEVSQGSTRIINFIEPAMILFMGVVVGVIVLAVLLPIFQISQSIR
jgi:type II secretory pathway component PulF